MRKPKANHSNTPSQKNNLKRRLSVENLEDRRLLAVTLDPSFDGDGMVTTNLGTQPSYDYGRDLVEVQTDGKIIVAGQGGNANIVVTRYNSDGSLDTTFDGDGIAEFSVGYDAYGVALDANGKILVGGTGRFGSTVNDFVALRLNVDGSLDTTFDGDGIAVVDFGSSSDQLRDLAIDSDGKIVLTGYSYQGTTRWDFAAARLNTDGSLDTSFSGDGKVTVDLYGIDDYGTGVSIDGNGKIVLGGYSYQPGTYSDFAAVRLNANGSLDTSFSFDGKVTVSFGGSSNEQAHGVTIDSDGKIVLVGYSYQGTTGWDFATARLNTDGSLDTSFSGDGKVTVDINGTTDQAYDVAIDGNGKIVLGGYSYQLGTYNDFAVARLHADGNLDTTFSSDGKATVDFGYDYDYGFGVATDSNNKVLVVGRSRQAATLEDFALARFNTNGTLDSTFSGDGRVTTEISRGTYEWAEDTVTLLPDGKVLVVADVHNPVGGFSELVLVRYNVDGSLDTTFGPDGTVSHAIGNGFSTSAMTVDSNGKIIVAGTSRPSTTNYDFAVVRFNPDGSLDTTFDGDGIKLIDFSGNYDRATAVAVDANGKIVVGGEARIGRDYRFAVLRLNSNGSLDSTFAGGGKLTFGFGTRNERLQDLAIAGDGRIVTTGYAYTSGYDFAVARINTNGTLDSSFDGDGKAIFDLGSSSDFAYGVAVDADNKVVVAGSTQTVAGGNDFAIVRVDTDGSLDTSFDGDGIVTTDFAGSSDWAYDVAVDANGKYVVGGEVDTAASTGWDFGLARYNADGSMDSGFGTSGKITTDFGTAYDGIWRLAIDVAGRIVAGGWDNEGDIALARYTTNQAPTADDASFEIAENTANGTYVGAVPAIDPDGDSLTYSVIGGTGSVAFDVDAGSGEITVADSSLLDYETTTSFTLDIQVDDGNGGIATATMTINLTNVTAIISGQVFVDINGDGSMQAAEPGIDGVTIELTGGIEGSQVDTTSMGGVYAFEVDDEFGTYQISEAQPTGVDDGAEILGDLGGIANPLGENDVMELTLNGNPVGASGYDFAEIGQAVTSGDTATIGFWQNKNGQRLITEHGDGLAAWLTENFSSVFGTIFADGSGGDDGAEVASFFKTEFFKKKFKGTPKADAQFMAVAFATYFTSSNLSGGTAAESYGFNVTETGIGTKVVNVGAAGAAFGVADDTDLTIMQLLLATASLTDNDGTGNNDDDGYTHVYDQNGDGILDDDELALRVLANDIYTSINEGGDI